MFRSLLDKIKRIPPFWAIPALLVFVGVVILCIEIGISDNHDQKALQGNVTQRQWYDSASGVHDDNQAQKYQDQWSADSPEYLRIPSAAGETAASTDVGSGSEVPGRNTVFVFRVYGRAHGVGLCMDGVQYRALAGQSCLDIINYYYTGVSIAHVDDGRTIRVRGRDGLIRTITLKEYLYRLAEEPESYPSEGLKVLYIAARTYTLSCIARGKHASQGFDVCASGGCCQAFNENKDLSKSPKNVAAVDATSGQVLYYDGAPIVAAYCGSCGGHTDNNEDVWGSKPLPYLRGKRDTYCSRSPHFCKEVDFSVSALEKKLNSSGSTSVGEIKLLDLSNRTPGGRVRTARIVGSKGTKEVSGKDLSKLLGFQSTRFDYSFR